eukprot:327310-Pleurochrysis_carterae.AAC.8
MRVDVAADARLKRPLILARVGMQQPLDRLSLLGRGETARVLQRPIVPRLRAVERIRRQKDHRARELAACDAMRLLQELMHFRLLLDPQHGCLLAAPSRRFGMLASTARTCRARLSRTGTAPPRRAPYHTIHTEMASRATSASCSWKLLHGHVPLMYTSPTAFVKLRTCSQLRILECPVTFQDAIPSRICRACSLV